MRVLSIIAVTLMSINMLASGTAAIGLQKPAEPLKVFLAANNRVFKRSDAIRLQVNLINADFNQSIFVYGALDWGYSASLTLHVRDASGKRVISRFYDDALTPPLKAGDNTAFVKLRPQHLLGTYYSSTIEELNMETPGKYRIFAEYHCPISVSEVDLRPFFGKDNGTIRSNVVEIQVVR